MLTNYKNEPFTDFSIEENRLSFEAALKKVDAAKGVTYPLIINGERFFTENTITSFNPSNSKEIIGKTASGTKDLAEKAILAAEKSFHSWKNTSIHERANYLFNAAAILRRRKFEFAALITEEAGKIWSEADGDVAEAIDFLEYYGRQALLLDKDLPLTPNDGEQNECHYIPLGVGIIIAPWNFPLAILAGMTAAAIVAGNTVVIKPSALTPIVAAKFMALLEEVTLPEGVVNFLPGPGRDCGNYMVAHPKTRFINFTGSMEVGLGINRTAAEVAPGQKWIKRVVAEMGGKNGIIVDADADLDLATDGIIAAAFGFQGQKCSACSRAIIVESVYEEVAKLVVEKAGRLTVGPAREYGNDMAAVVDSASYEKVLKYIELGKKEGKLLCGGVLINKNGYFIPPTVIGEVDENARLSQEEVFGPLLALVKAKDFEDALRIANNTIFGLTGSVFTKNRRKIEKAKKEFHAGNLYINRKSTGALVGVEPFGGFNMSGTDSKAGGPDYLLQFMQAKTIGENF